MDTWKVILAVVAAIAVAFIAAFGIGYGVFETTDTSTTTTTMMPDYAMPKYKSFRYFAVTSPSEICSQIGVDILQEHQGSATDAASAVLICDGVVNMGSHGIGGGGFATIYEKPKTSETKEFKAYLFRERAPGDATPMMFQNKSSLIGGLAIGVPGVIKGIYDMWTTYGKVEWKELFDPTIELLEKGFRIGKILADQIKEYETQIKERSTLKEIFILPDGTMLKEGDIFRDAKLAKTFRTIANDSNAFYSGQLAQDIAADIRDNSGIITAADLQNYQTSIKEPLNITLQDGKYTFYNPPPPSGAVVVDFILNVLSGYNFNEDDVQDQEKMSLAYHRIIEAFRFGYAKRGLLGDVDFARNLTELLNNMTSLEYGKMIRAKIFDDRTQKPEAYDPGYAARSDNGTGHINVLTQDGSAVSLTATINTPFGSLVRGSRTGIIFNNEMDDFSTPGVVNIYGFPPSPSNFIAPGKIPQSSMSPILVMDNTAGKIAYLVGSSDGGKMISSNAQVIVSSLWFGRPLDEAINTARVHDQLAPDEVQYESWIDQNLLTALKNKGHTMVPSYGAVADTAVIHNTCMMVAMEREPCIIAMIDHRGGGYSDGL